MANFKHWNEMRTHQGRLHLGRMHQGGMILLAINIVLLTTALGILVVVQSVRLERERGREQELLFIGEQFLRAIESYAKAIDGTGIQYPQDLQSLLLDSRGGQQRRHLRRIYTDPMTGKAEWGLIKDPNGILGVHSLSKKPPIRKTGFANKLDHFRSARGYDDWQFRVIAPIQSVALSSAESATGNPEKAGDRP